MLARSPSSAAPRRLAQMPWRARCLEERLEGGGGGVIFRELGTSLCFAKKRRDRAGERAERGERGRRGRRGKKGGERGDSGEKAKTFEPSSFLFLPLTLANRVSSGRRRRPARPENEGQGLTRLADDRILHGSDRLGLSCKFAVVAPSRNIFTTASPPTSEGGFGGTVIDNVSE